MFNRSFVFLGLKGKEFLFCTTGVIHRESMEARF